MKNFVYKDIGQHGSSYDKTLPVQNPADKNPSRKPAGKLHKKRGLKSITLVRPAIS